MSAMLNYQRAFRMAHMVHLRQSHLVQIDLLEPAVNLPTAVPAANSSILEILDGFQKPS